MKARAPVATLALATALLVWQVAGAGGQSGSSTPATSGTATTPLAAAGTPNPNLDFSLKNCGEHFDHYYLGASFQGLALRDEDRICSDPEPTPSQSAGGRVDPDSLGRSNFVSYIYGSCEAEPEMGCAPPLEIQTWPACERSAGDYNFGEPEAPQTLRPEATGRTRGVPARFYGEGRLELSTGDVTVVLFGDSKVRLQQAAEELRSAPDSGQRRGPGEELPAPERGAEDGTLRC